MGENMDIDWLPPCISQEIDSINDEFAGFDREETTAPSSPRFCVDEEIADQPRHDAVALIDELAPFLDAWWLVSTSPGQTADQRLLSATPGVIEEYGDYIDVLEAFEFFKPRCGFAQVSVTHEAAWFVVNGLNDMALLGCCRHNRLGMLSRALQQ